MFASHILTKKFEHKNKSNSFSTISLNALHTEKTFTEINNNTIPENYRIIYIEIAVNSA